MVPLALLILLFLSPYMVNAEVTASPVLIDLTVEARDIIEESITITNTGSVPTRLFASVNEITLGEGGTIETFIPPSMSDRTTSVTSWIAVDRGRKDLPPGETVVVPISLRINPNAVPGTYFAFVGFGSGSNRDEAEAKILAGQGSGAIVRLQIKDGRASVLQLLRFSIDRFVSTFKEHAISYTIDNPGEIPHIPVGEVIVYNSRGEEVTALTLNDAGEAVGPGESKKFTVTLPPDGLFGKYKAFLSVRYGDSNTATIYDTAFFYAAPITYLAGIFVIIFGTILGVLLFWRQKYADHPHDDHDGHVAVYVRNGSTSNEQHHDIDLKKTPTE